MKKKSKPATFDMSQIDPAKRYQVEIGATGGLITILTSTHTNRDDLLFFEEAFDVIPWNIPFWDDLIESEVLPDVVACGETEEPHYEAFQRILRMGHRTLNEFVDAYFSRSKQLCSLDDHGVDAFINSSAKQKRMDLPGFLSAPCIENRQSPVLLDWTYFLDRGVTAVGIIHDRFRGTVGATIPGHALRGVADAMTTRTTTVRLGRQVFHFDVIESIRLGEYEFPVDYCENWKPHWDLWLWLPPKARAKRK